MKLTLPKDHPHAKGRTCTECGEFKAAKEYQIERDVRSFGGVTMRSKCRPCNEFRKYKGFIKRAYGITWEDYCGMLDAQGGVCAICKDPDSGNIRTSGKLFVDHCHSTNKVRGLLCSRCNHGLGHFRDDLQLLVNAMSYLQTHNSLKGNT